MTESARFRVCSSKCRCCNMSPHLYLFRGCWAIKTAKLWLASSSVFALNALKYCVERLSLADTLNTVSMWSAWPCRSSAILHRMWSKRCNWNLQLCNTCFPLFTFYFVAHCFPQCKIVKCELHHAIKKAKKKSDIPHSSKKKRKKNHFIHFCQRYECLAA